MNSLPLTLGRLSFRRSATVSAFVISFLFGLASVGRAEVGNDNPTGPAGIFNGEVLGYDPYTGNVKRSVMDISIAGAVSPLALTRIYNSRDPTGAHFGSNGWHHSYEWTIDPSGNVPGTSFPPAAYVVNFPDGRRETFQFVNWDCSPNPPYPCLYRVWGWQRGVDSSAGVRERFQQLNMNGLLCYLILPNGGKVEFQAARHNAGNNNYYYTYQATGIIDPYGLKTTLTYETTGSKRLLKVQEPAGRYIQFNYRPNNSQLLDNVTGSDGRVVKYNYTNLVYPPGNTHYLELDNVGYFNGQWTASYKYRAPNTNGANGIPLLYTADDPMYEGPMKRIAYQYKTENNLDGSPPAYGQIWKVRYWDGTTQNAGSGLPVSTLDVTARNTRKETRGDTKWRTFTYGTADTNLTGHLLSCTDFMNHTASQTYDDGKNYINSVTDFNGAGHRTDYTLNALTGNVTQMQFPATADVTPSPAPRGTINYTYGWASCHDSNNTDANNPYYVCTATDEGGHVTKFWRDTNHRITKIDYPDGGYETFSYDPSHFYQLSTHRMTTGGTETFAYDALHRKQYYSDAYHNNVNNPSIQYFYDVHGWITGAVDAFNHPTNWDYNDCGQLRLITLATDPVDNTRHTITNVYNSDGTLRNKTDELGHLTSYEYDDYRRLKSVTLPARGDGSGTHTAYYYYDANGTGDDYRYTDSNVTWVILPSGKKTKTLYDDNRRKTDVTVGWGTADAAITNYGYDGVGNVTSITHPLNHSNVTTIYDARNRPSVITVGDQTTTFKYDTAGRKKIITRPNGQVITNASFDEMNRVLQQNVTQTPGPLAVTKYSYYPSGLLNTMTDPHNTTDSYTYVYDLMGRKQNVTYPPDLNGNQWTEHFTYDAAGRLETFKNRQGNTQSFSYDALNRATGFHWDDTPRTPSVTFAYDAASRLTDINNANATIQRLYWNDDLLGAEIEQITGGTSKTVMYFYDDDGNRANVTYPDYQTFAYTYTGRNQLKAVGPWATYDYAANGNLMTRTLPPNNTHTDYSYDVQDRVTSITHTLHGTSRTISYGYYEHTYNRKWTRRPGGIGDVFDYGLSDQAIVAKLNVPNADTTAPGSPTILYDANGNRTNFHPYGPTDIYVTNKLNQYSSRNSNTATYNAGGNLIYSPDPAGSRSTYGYDAQNRLLNASKGAATMSFSYDGLNRQVSRTVNGVTTYNVYDGWDLIEEYQAGGTVTAKYVQGPGGPIKELVNNRYYYQDGSGSTSHLADSNGNLLEWYRYDLDGTPIVNDQPTNHSSAFGVRHLFNGQQWYSEVGLYDLRNRFYSPDIGRFLQPDPTGFEGDATNLYRYCGNNPVTRSDPSGNRAVPDPRGWYTYVVNPGWGQYVWTPGYVPGSNGWCAAGTQILSGGWSGGAYHDVPKTDYWFQGASLTSATRMGTVVAKGWQDGGYPGLSPGAYVEAYPGASDVNHAGIFLFVDAKGKAVILDQYQGKILGLTSVSPNDQWKWNEVYVDKGDGPYASGTSGDPNGRGGVVVSAPPLSKNEQAKLRGLFRLAMMNNPYWGYLPTTNTTNWAGGIAGLPSGGSPWDLDNQQGGVDPFANVGSTWGEGFRPADEPGMGPGCFVAGTPVLMADGSEKSIESIQVGEAVLAWNEETKQMFSTNVVSALHHEEKMQTLFDIDLEDGRKFTVNNDHPMYVVEDSDFKFTDELATRFAKGEPITFQDSKNQPVKIANLRMRNQVCKVYNLYVEGQGKNGHTYYANGILVHNAGAGNRFK